MKCEQNNVIQQEAVPELESPPPPVVTSVQTGTSINSTLKVKESGQLLVRNYYINFLNNYFLPDYFLTFTNLNISVQSYFLKINIQQKMFRTILISFLTSGVLKFCVLNFTGFELNCFQICIPSIFQCTRIFILTLFKLLFLLKRNINPVCKKSQTNIANENPVWVEQLR